MVNWSGIFGIVLTLGLGVQHYFMHTNFTNKRPDKDFTDYIFGQGFAIGNYVALSFILIILGWLTFKSCKPCK